MDLVLIGLVSLAAAAMTLFSGFGLGTILTPVFVLCLPVEIAVATTAVVHLANNLFKLTLIGRWAHWPTVLRFGLPAIPAALLGAGLLVWLSEAPSLAAYKIGDWPATITPVKLTIALLIGIFAIVEMRQESRGANISTRWMPLGGVLSGFLGGVSGHQGALRSAFLLRAELDHQQFIGTNTAIAVLVDLARLSTYGLGLWLTDAARLMGGRTPQLAAVAIVCAFTGSFVGSRLVKKITIVGLRRFVAGMMLILAAALGAGLV
ncbi:MAG: sulfite exporter TauE/SafE family protein [Planctomycetes bacterium]|nr:sulfite exporter TauE/SafE family protein [Planctomycetota bacterium]